MSKKNIFKKKNNSFKIFFAIIILIFIIIFLYFFFIKSNYNFTYIPSFENKFYIIPKDKGGEKILNTDKKSLHLNDINQNNNAKNIENLYYSIQFFVSTNYSEINKFLNDLLNNYENIYNKEDFYILAMNTELGIDYFLLYMNFQTKEEAKIYCSNYVDKVDNCLIVNAQNF